MAYVTFGVKVPEDLKNELTNLMNNSGMHKADFMALLRDLYKQILVNPGETYVETAASTSTASDPSNIDTLIDEVKGLVNGFTDQRRLTEEIQRLEHEVERLECVADVQFQHIEELTATIKYRTQRLRDRIDEIYQLKQQLTETKE
jgi:vacuolar-type H+-ATPase subunit I/STV1